MITLEHIFGTLEPHLFQPLIIRSTFFHLSGPVEFEEDPRLGVLVSGAGGPPSDISDKSGNSADKVSIGGLSGSGSIGALKKEGSGKSDKKVTENAEYAIPGFVNHCRFLATETKEG